MFIIMFGQPKSSQKATKKTSNSPPSGLPPPSRGRRTMADRSLHSPPLATSAEDTKFALAFPLCELRDYPGITQLLEKSISSPNEISPHLQKIYRVPHPYFWGPEQIRESLQREFSTQL
jgi:hypothetical protein